MFGQSTSAFWFYGRLSPSAALPEFFVQEIFVSEWVRIEVALEQLGIWSRPGTAEYKQPGEITQLGRQVVGVWSLLSGRGLDWSLEGWIEATNAELDGSIMGVINRRDAKGADESSLPSRQIRTAAEIAIQLADKPDMRLAIGGIQAALKETSEDSMLFAFRAVECAARALTGADGAVDAQKWAEFHCALERDPVQGKEFMAPLTEARRKVAHGELDPGNPMSDEKRRELVLIGRRLVTEALEADPAIKIDQKLDLQDEV